MTSSRGARPLDDSPDWGTDALTGLIPPRGETPTRDPASSAAASDRPVRWAIYGLLALIALGGGAIAMRRASAPSVAGARGRLAATAPGSAGIAADRAEHRPEREVRAVQAPTPKAAALAFARGDYEEALAQYRALARLYPEQLAYQSLSRVLDRRLAPRPVRD